MARARLILFLVPLGVVLAAFPAGAADPRQPAQKAEDSLDEQLLRDLEGDLIDDGGTTDKQPAGEREPAKEHDRDASSEGDEALRRQLGEDLGEETQEDPLTRIGRQMRSVEELIAKRNVSEPTQELQDRIVADLEKLIKQCCKQKSSGGGSANQKPAGNSRSRVRQPGAGSPREGTTANRPARDASERLGRDEARQLELAETKELMKDEWGKLPDRIREQMLQNPVEQFLPKYEVLIGKYFRRLAEDAEDAP